MSLILAALLSVSASALQVPPEPRLGGGNLPAGGDPAKFGLLRDLGASVCRLPLSPREYWDGGKAVPERADAGVLMAHAHGIEPVLLFEYYTRWKETLGDRAKWLAIGAAFAERFRPGSPWLEKQGIRGWGITVYTAINEPEWKDNNPEPIPPEAYAAALEGLADGVHGVDRALQVVPGGYQEVPLFQNRDPYLKAVARLYNEGKLAAIDIHRYWDVDYVPMAGRRDFSLQSQFEKAKRDAGITADVGFHTTEMNFKHRKVTQEEAARGFLTALWDALTVTGAGGQRVSRFVMPWNIFNTESQDPEYGMCERASPWTPNARGRVLRNVLQLTRGMTFVSTDPKGTGVTVLEGPSGKLWVWQNRKGWSTLAGPSFELKDIPAGTREIEIHGWDGLRRKVPAAGGAQRLEGLETEETLLFRAIR
jgi:hypothetical protein